jgi:uncharacterized phage protein gp47/JayE
MAEGLPTPKSREQILSEMLTEYTGLTGVNDLNTGSVLTQFFDVVARSVARTSGDIFQILRDYSVDRATGEALSRIGEEERIFRKTSRTANGAVKVTDSSFQKISTKVYAGASSPNIGSTVIKVSDASDFPASGTVYIGRGTPNIEGPLNYVSTAQVGAYWEITLASPTTKFHNISESVILGQGGTRNIPVGTTVLSPGTGAVADITYTVSSAAILLDGENENPFVQVVAQEPGSASNAPAGAIRQFGSSPFTGAEVINERPFTTGADTESDDNYRDRIKKERLSRGLGTALAVKNAVLGAQASDENAVVTSNEIDTTNPEETILYIDNGQGYEEKTEGVGIEFIIDSAIGGERSFQLSTGGRQTSVAKAFLISSETSPYSIKPYDKLAILVGGLISEHVFGEADFKASGSATAYEIVASINNNTDLKFEATTAEGGSKVLIKAKTEDNEFLQLSTPTTGTDTGPVLGFTKNEIRTILLYKNRELLDKNGRVAFVVSKNQFDWNNSITAGDTLTLSVDGTDPITYTFTNQDFLDEGQHSIVSNQNTLSSWANVINSKVTGITAEVNGEQLKLTSNLSSANRAAISIDPTSALVAKGMFSAALGLSAQGNEADFELSRNTAQIKLNIPLSEGDSLKLGSEYTRAEINSTKILGGQTTVSGTAYIWLLVDDINAEPVSIGVTGDTFLNVSKPGGGVVRYTSTVLSAFDDVQVGDYVIVWSDELSAPNRLEGRVNAVTSTTLDIRVTAAEEAAAIAESPILFSEGFAVIRCEKTPQKVKIPAGIYNINSIATIMNSQLKNATVKIDNDEVFVIRTNTEDLDGGLFLVDFNDPAKSLNFVKNSISQSINSQLAFYESGNQDKQFPAFVHGEITADVYADPSDSFITNITSSEDLAALGLDPSGFLCFSQPYNSVEDIVSTECVEIQNFSGSTVNLEESAFYRRSRANDRYHVLNGFDFGHEDSVVAILDGDPNQKTFDMPLYRTAVTNITLPANPDEFRAYDLEGGNSDFTDFFDADFSFDNYKCLMQARNIIDPGNPTGVVVPSTSEDAILYRAAEWGRSGEKIGVGYFYPTSPNQGIAHVVDVNTQIDVKIFLKSGASRSTTIDGTTEWNVTINPLSAAVDLVTYTHSGTGSAPGLGAVIAGDYVSILGTGEFDSSNIGSYKIYARTATSFTVKRASGSAVIQSNVATLQNITIAFFESSATTAQDIVTYVTSNLSNFITASLVNDSGLTGAGVIDDSTEEDLNYADSYVRLLDGKNYILASDLGAGAGLPQFTFKNSLALDSFSTNTLDAYNFNNGENIRLIPITATQVSEFLNVLAVTGFATLGEIKTVDRNSKVQLSTSIIGEAGSIQIAGGLGTSSSAAIEGSSAAIGEQSNRSCIVSVNAAAAAGFHSDQWVKAFASDKQRKTTLINALNSIKISSSTPTLGYSKIEIFDRGVEQRFFGRNRYHTRTLGRTFKVEKQGQFACISWDDVGTQPFFLKTSIDLKDSTSGTLTIYKNDITNVVDITVDSGNMRFDEVAIGDLLTISNRANSENNGQFLITGRSSDAKTLRFVNENAVNELAQGSFTITNNTTVVGGAFTVGSTTLTEGVDFIVGATSDDTASNLAAAISLLPNITATSTLSVANISSDVPGVTVALAFAGAGATVSGAFMIAPAYSSGDLSVQSEVQEGDSVSISSDFNILNQGIYRIIRRFKNSIYIDNSNVVEEEVTLEQRSVDIIPSFAITPKLVFTQGGAIVTSVGAVSWTTGLSSGYLIKQASKDDVFYYKILSIDSLSQVTLSTPFLEASSGAAGFSAVYTIPDTDYNVQKMDGINKLFWAGNGLEPLLENMRPGDIVTLGTDFNIANRGSFHVVDSGEKLKEITKLTMSVGSTINSGEYALINSTDDATEYYLWYNVDLAGGDPAPVGKTPIEVQVLSIDTAATVATKTANKFNTTFSADFVAVASGNTVTITNTTFGPATDAVNVDISGDFEVEVTQQGRRNFVDYINVNGISESGITILDVLQFHREAMKFKEYEGAIPGDTFVITNNFLGASNKKSFVVSDVLSEAEIIVVGTSTSVNKTLLDSNFNKIYLEESTPYVGYKRISLVSTNPANLNDKNIVFDSENQFEKIGEIGGVSLTAMSKLAFDTGISKGVDSYKYNIGLIAEANRIVYGDPRDNTTYPGVAAAGAEIFIKSPLVKRIEVSISVRVKTGIPFTTIVEEVRNSVAALINSNPVGQYIPISNIVSTVGAIVGVQAVAISSPQYSPENDVIRVNAGEKSLILDIISDITVAKNE